MYSNSSARKTVNVLHFKLHTFIFICFPTYRSAPNSSASAGWAVFFFSSFFSFLFLSFKQSFQVLWICSQFYLFFRLFLTSNFQLSCVWNIYRARNDSVANKKWHFNWARNDPVTFLTYPLGLKLCIKSSSSSSILLLLLM